MHRLSALKAVSPTLLDLFSALIHYPGDCWVNLELFYSLAFESGPVILVEGECVVDCRALALLSMTAKNVFHGFLFSARWRIRISDSD